MSSLLRRSLAIVLVALPATANAQTAVNLSALGGLVPFSALLDSAAGKAALERNQAITAGIQSGSHQPGLVPFAEQRERALEDAYITSANASQLADGLGTKLGAVYQSLAAYTSPDDGTTTSVSQVSPDVATLMGYTSALTGADSAAAKFFFANATFVTKASTVPVTGDAAKLLVDANGTTDVYGKAYSLPGGSTGADPFGDSRPFQTEPGFAKYDGTDYFGVATNNTAFLSGSAQNLTASPSFPSGHTTYGYTESLLLAILVPARFDQMVARGAEYGNSRIVIGAHYAMDVIAGRTLATYDVAQLLAGKTGYAGATFGQFAIADYPAAVEAARADVTKALESGCGNTIAICANEDQSRFSNATKDEAFYESTQTYGLPVVNSRTAGTVEDVNAVAPEAGRLIVAAFPKLSLVEADRILTETEGPGGGFLDDGSRFGLYSRLDLYEAGKKAAAVTRDAADWPLPGADLANTHFSALRSIDTTNVANLKPRWTFHTGMKGGFEATPIVLDGIMYLSTAGDDVVALDAATGALKWRYHHTLRHTPCCGVANRGVAVSQGLVFVATADARLLALDRSSGAIVWDVPLADDSGVNAEHASDLGAGDRLRGATVIGQSGVFANMAPQIYRDEVIVGITGVGYGLHLANGKPDGLTGGVVGVAGVYGTRGYYAAFDAKTGTRRWRWYTIPDAGWEGSFRATTPDGAALPRDLATEHRTLAEHGDAWRSGGGSAWTTPAIDPEHGLMYVGVGNPSPQFQDLTRPFDNLYSVSLVALDIATGTVRWAYQEVPHDLWGYDVASPPVLLDVNVGGRSVPAIMQAGKTGWLYVIDRTTGALLRRSDPFVPQEHLFARPTVAGITIAPGAFGGASWSPIAYDGDRNLTFVAAAHLPMLYRARTSAVAADGTSETYTEATPDDSLPHWGTVSAIDPQTGKIRWQRKTAQPLVGGVLATAGGLAFFGEGDGSFEALDSSTGERLWSYACDAGVNAPPVAYAVAGKQYVAVAAGGNALFGYKRGDSLVSFALGAP